MEIELLMEGALGKLEPESFTKQLRELGEKEQGGGLWRSGAAAPLSKWDHCMCV